MRVIRNLQAMEPALRGASVAIGNFDGVHPGHQVVIGTARDQAKAAGTLSGVLTFEPHARRFFRPDTPAFSLTTLDDKIALIERLGIDLFIALDFDASMAACGADNFIQNILINGLGVSHVIVGHDFHFGHDRLGNPDLLARAGTQLGFKTTKVEPVEGASGLYASTAIRQALQSGKPELATDLLGRHWTIRGPVTKGDQRGRTINFPTANIALGEYLEPALGVYAVRITRADGTELKGVANLGRRPTFAGTEVRLETHIFDFADDLYGEILTIALIRFLRPEQKFDGLDSLKSQIAKDAATARMLLT